MTNPEQSVTRRQVLLERAIQITTQDRNQSYGEPSKDLNRVAQMWTIIFGPLLKEGARFSAHHVAMAMECVKLSRLVESPDHFDSWTDLAGWAGVGFEVATDQK